MEFSHLFYFYSWFSMVVFKKFRDQSCGQRMIACDQPITNPIRVKHKITFNQNAFENISFRDYLSFKALVPVAIARQIILRIYIVV